MFVAVERDYKECDWSEYILIIPSVSVGNVGQLTADLLINTLYLNKIGYFLDDGLLPMVGNDPYSTCSDGQICNLVTGTEVYTSSSQKLVVVQQRAPFVKGKMAQFREKLMSWIKEKKFKQVIILSSSHAHMRIDAQLIGSQGRYLATTEFEEITNNYIHENLDWIHLEKPESTSDACDTELYIPGGGIAKSLFLACKIDHIPALCVLTFCSEGENAPDAISLANYLDQYLKVNEGKHQYPGPDNVGHTPWKIPVSWKLLFGSRQDQMIF